MSLPDTNDILSVSNLTIQYPSASKKAVDKISFQVKGGEVIGILGGNGAGKSTTLKAIAGLIPTVEDSKIIVYGREITKLETKEDARLLIGYCPDTGGLIRQATVEDHIQLVLGNKRYLEKELAYQIIEQMGLIDNLSQEAGSFSHGMSRRLAVSLAVLNSDKVLILDEPFDGVDPIGVEAIQNIIKLAKENGLGVIVSTHLLSLLAEVSDRVIVMNKGRIIFKESGEYFRKSDANIKYAEILKSDIRETLREM
jgi:ABC-2 type transport system ATP-binding protein